MRGLPRRVVELAVLHARTSTHALNVAGRNAFNVAHVVFVRQRTAEYIADDFHVFVRMCAKTRAGRNSVFVNHTQISKTHMGMIEISGKRKRVERLEPAMVCIAARGGGA